MTMMLISVQGCVEWSAAKYNMAHIQLYLPQNVVLVWVYCFHIVTFWFFLDIIVKNVSSNFAYSHMDIDMIYICNKKIMARGQFFKSCCPLYKLIG